MKAARFLTILGAALAVGLAARPADAQVRFAPQLAWGEDHDLAIGGRLLVNLSRLTSTSADRGFASRLDAVVPFDWFVDCTDCTYFEVTPSLLLPLTIRNVGPYVGAGVNIARISVNAPGQDESDVSLGLGLTGGLLVPVGRFTSFGEIRFTAGGARQTVITAGLQLGTRRR